MKNKKDYSQLFGIFRINLFFSKNLLIEFEKIFRNKEINEYIPRVKLVYMEIIILNLAKIFSESKCDKFSIVQLKNISPQKSKEKLLEIEKLHKDIIGKILANRNKIIAHTDKDFDTLCFSNNKIKAMGKNIKNSMRISKKEVKNIFSKMNRTIDRDKERYTPIDLKRDSSEIKNIIEEVDKILIEVLMFHYNKK